MKIIDVSDTFTVLGSGLSAISAILTLKESNKQISVIDYGIEKDAEFNKKEFIKTKKQFISPKFRSADKYYVYSKFKKNLKISTKNFSAIGSLAKGGLSNLWGASLQPYNNDNLLEYPYNYEDVKDDYSFISKILTGNKFDLNSLNDTSESKNMDKRIKNMIKQNDKNKIKFMNSFNAFLHTKSKIENKYSESNDIFNAKVAFEKLSNYKRLNYYNNKLINNINKEGQFYLIETFDVKNRETIIFKAKIIFCSLGVLTTTKLILKMNKAYEHKIPLLNTPCVSFMIFSPFQRNTLKETQWFKSSLSFKTKIDDINLNGNIFNFTEDLGMNLLKLKFLGRSIYKILDYLIFSRIFICNAFLPSYLSKNTIHLGKDDKLNIVGNISLDLRNAFAIIRKNLIKNFLQLGYITLFIKLMKPGEDIHYGGSLPMSSNAKKLECNDKGELFNHKNFYITDASSMVYLPGKTHTFNMMVQARKIVREAVAKLTN